MSQVEMNSTSSLDNGQILIREALRAGRVDASTLAGLRTYFDEVAMSRADAEALFEIDRIVDEKTEDWTTFFVAAVTDFIVWQSRPTGLVTSEQAEWLVAEADKGRTLNGFATLVNVLAEADRVPSWLPAAVHGRAARWPGLGALEALKAA